VGEELKWEPQVTASQIGIQVKDGVITLSGEVSSYAEKWNAERAAQRVSGVNALAADLKVKLQDKVVGPTPILRDLQRTCCPGRRSCHRTP